MGKTWTTSVRRLISRLIRSNGFVDWIFFQWCLQRVLLRTVEAVAGPQQRRHAAEEEERGFEQEGGCRPAQSMPPIAALSGTRRAMQRRSRSTP